MRRTPLKLIVQIPCLNEEQTLAATLADIPREIPGIDSIELLVIDDGSTDGTVQVAAAAGVEHILSNKSNQGLARSFSAGLQHALRLGADIVVNTDGDNQYCGADLPALVQPILEGKADIVIGDRQVQSNPHFGKWKKRFQALGSATVRTLSGTRVPDAVSGFRAITREAGLRLNIISPFSYTTEMIIQAGNKNMTIVSVPVRTNPVYRQSRLFRSIPQFISQQAVSIVRMYAMYRPMRFFFFLGSAVTVIGLIPTLRFLFFYFSGDGDGHIQSLVLGGVTLMLGFLLFVTGLLADLISHNRRLAEMSLETQRRMALDQAGQEAGKDR
jgi:glycosyltransferase involved in cell wall biosynthesis